MYLYVTLQQGAIQGTFTTAVVSKSALNRGNIFLTSIIEFFSIFDLLKIKVVSLWGGGGRGTW